MDTIRWAAPLALVATLAIGGAGCGDRSTGETGGGRATPEAPDGPLNRNDENEARNSPLDIPRITQSQGQPVTEVRKRLEADLRKQCGGTLCVRVRVRQGDNDILSTCQFDDTDPAPGSRVERGGTVTILTGTLPCATATTGDDSAASTEPQPTGTS
ncbi:PASTA domain-containing protein [Micromonospora sp. NPDC049559]|uniref:PASTA domain-containing protein n=1 Tax=Micromonospora sp. NPDC049559 TaxID=3155923 RepID=UPI00341CF7EA